MEEEPTSQEPRSKGTEENLAFLREQSNTRETGNEREEEEQAATNKDKKADPEKKDPSTDRLETELNLRNLDLEEKNAILENSLIAHINYDTKVAFYEEMREEYDNWKNERKKNCYKSTSGFIEFKPGEDKENAMKSRAGIVERSKRMTKRVRDATEKYVAKAQEMEKMKKKQ